MSLECKLHIGERVFYLGLDFDTWIWDLSYEWENAEYFRGRDTTVYGHGHRAGLVYLAYGKIGRKV